LPNLTERTPLHPGRGPGLSDRRLGEAGGAATGSLTQAQIPSHTHPLTGTASVMGGTARGQTTRPAGMAWAGAREETPFAATADAALAPGAARLDFAADGAEAHANRPPSLAVNFIIALVGLYPSRS
jgi:microcystin-dependent protein